MTGWMPYSARPAPATCRSVRHQSVSRGKHGARHHGTWLKQTKPSFSSIKKALSITIRIQSFLHRHNTRLCEGPFASWAPNQDDDEIFVPEIHLRNIRHRWTSRNPRTKTRRAIFPCSWFFALVFVSLAPIFLLCVFLTAVTTGKAKTRIRVNERPLGGGSDRIIKRTWRRRPRRNERGQVGPSH